MSHNSGGFFSLNRLFGKKIKHEKPSSMDLSKSTIQTSSRSNTNPDGISPQNKIAPLTTIPNAPFEQTFRITVYLPLGQLYVARIGAKTKLSELLNTICTNKSLDPTKFEFKHPTDVTQVFDLSFTVGEVGLSEIKLVPKNVKEDTSVRYRSHSNFSRDNRFGARPHTMSSVSPYSSTNSLNSTDSSGIMMNQRVNNSGVPVAPNRKKRIAPRPPSQNSIPENPEKICSKDESNSHSIVADSNIDAKHSNLLRQNFHMSSPNLAMSNSLSFKSNEIDINTSVTNSFDRRQSENYINNNRKVSLNRPLSIQLNKTANDDYSHEFKSQTSENLNSRKSHGHSRTPSDASATNDIIWPEPQPRTRPPINKKKAPAPPPRTVSANLSGHPIATPRNAMSKLSIVEDAQDEMIIDETHKSPCSPNLDNLNISAKKSTNVSKIMLNVNEKLSNNDENVENRISDNNVNIEEMSCHVETTTSNPKDQQNIKFNETTTESVTKTKSVSVVDLNSSNYEKTDELTESDQTAVAAQVNEIIDEAVQINQSRKSTELNKEYEKIPQTENCFEINNNNENSDDKDHHEEKQNGEKLYKDFDRDKRRPQIQISSNGSEDLKTATVEVPIQPVLNETRTFSFHEYNDNSLPTSTTSTLNTTETPSTGPESLITSDIEDGYKGNELEKKRKSEVVKCDSKEDFIESQFEFLKEHLDNKNIDSDEEKTMEFSKRDIISSTMINENYKQPDKRQPVDKHDLINELTQIISCNRLDTFIKPNAQTDDSVAASKQSSLKNFQISAYSNGNLETTKSKPISYISESRSEQSLNPIECGDKSGSQSIFDSNGLSHATEDGTNNDVKSDETFVIPKQINRSVSFHSTSASALNDEASEADVDPGLGLYTTQRCSSYLSLNGPQKYEQNTVQSQENCLMELVQKSSSELSIADTPSLQSIKVMKSILNSSIKMNPDSKHIQKEEKTSDANENEVVMDSQIRSDAHKKETVAINQKKAWSYQGPPSINFSTWGDRPKTTVNIKSDEDYIFGGTSKMAALQKRFSGVETEKRKDVQPVAELSFKKPNLQCDSSLSKLPVVRSVEYKKNVHNDSPDSNPQITSFRPNYEVSHIVSKNSFTKNENTFFKDNTENNVFKAIPIKMTSSTQSVNSNSNFMPRVQSFNIPKETQSINQVKVTKEVETEAVDEPIFTQFKLRKTGLKEKMFDKSCKDDAKLSNGSQIENSTKPIPTAPKPPPILAKPKIRAVSMNNKVDTRDQLLDSIRNFKRDTLKRNVIY